MADPVSLPTNFLRLGKFPIDETIVVATYQQLTAYAATNPTSYTGQIVAVTALDTAYIIRGDKTVLPLQTGALSGNWQNTFNVVNSNSANWISNYSFVNSNSANWSSVYSLNLSNSAGWESSESTVNSNSANWSSVYSLILNNSAGWESSESTVNANSANWSSVYSLNLSNSAGWESSESTVNSNSANWSSVYSNVNSNSANWNSVYSNINSNSSKYESVFSNTNLNSGLDLQSRTFVNNNSANIVSVNTKVNSTSGNWDSVYSTYNTNSSLYATKQYTANNFLALTGGYVTGDVSIGGNLYLLGSATQISTEDLILTNSLIYLASGNPADIVDIGLVGYTSSLNFGRRFSGLIRDSGTKKWFLFSNLSSISGYDVNINDPSLTIDTLKANIEGNLITNTLVFGDLSASGNVYGNNLKIENWNKAFNDTNIFNTNSGKYESVFSNVNSNSANWSSVYSNVNSASGNSASVYSNFNTNSGRYQSVFSNVNSNSANWSSVYSNVNSLTGKYESVYSNINTTSANWSSVYSNINTNSGKYESVHSNVNANSANWASVYNNVNLLTANYNSAYSNVNSNSGDWESVYSNINNTSANWSSVYNNVNTVSSNWQSNYNTTQNLSSDWNSNFSTVCALSGDWESVYTQVNSNSSFWQDTYITVQNNSGTIWNYQGTDIKELTGRWESNYTNSNVISALDLNVRTFVNQNSANFNSLYSSVCSNSSTYATISFSDSKYIPLSSVDKQLNANSTNAVTNSAITNRILQIENSLNILVPAPTYTAPAATLTVFSPTEFEVGQTVTRSLTLGYTPGDGGAATNYRLEKNSSLVQEQATAFTQNVNETAILGLTRYTCIVTHLSGAIKPNIIGLPDARGVITAGTKSINRDYNAYYRQFFGSVNTLPTSPALVRNLTGLNFTTTNSFTFYVYTRNIAIAIPSSKQLVSIITGSFENLTTNFNLSTTQVPDAGGTPRDYKLYTYTTVNPYNSNFTITLS